MSDICVSIIKAHFDFTYSETGHSTESLIDLRRYKYFKRQSRFKVIVLLRGRLAMVVDKEWYF